MSGGTVVHLLPYLVHRQLNKVLMFVLFLLLVFFTRSLLSCMDDVLELWMFLTRSIRPPTHSPLFLTIVVLSARPYPSN